MEHEAGICPFSLLPWAPGFLLVVRGTTEHSWCLLGASDSCGLLLYDTQATIGPPDPSVA
jgi:hypothetical protein